MGFLRKIKQNYIGDMLYNIDYSVKVKRILLVTEFLILFMIGVTFFSLSFFSLRTSFTSITWVVTALLLTLLLFVFFFRDIRFDLFIASFILFAILSLISTAMNGFLNFRLTIFLYIIVAIFLYQYIVQNKKRFKYVIFAVYLGLLAFAFMFFFQYRESIFRLDFSSRQGSHFGDENNVSMFLGLGCVLSLYFGFYLKSIPIKIISFICFAVFLVCGILPGSKIFLLSLTISTLFLVFCFFGKKRWYVSVIILLLLVGSFIFIALGPINGALKERVLKSIDTFLGTNLSNSYRLDTSTIDRLDLMKSGFELFLIKPFFGYGVNGYQNFGFGGGWSHNTYSEVLCNYGLFGFISFFFCVPYFFSIFKHKRDNTFFVSFVILVFFFGCSFSVSLEAEKIYMYLIGICAAVACEFESIASLRITIKDKRIKPAIFVTKLPKINTSYYSIDI